MLASAPAGDDLERQQVSLLVNRERLTLDNHAGRQRLLKRLGHVGELRSQVLQAAREEPRAAGKQVRLHAQPVVFPLETGFAAVLLQHRLGRREPLAQHRPQRDSRLDPHRVQ